MDFVSGEILTKKGLEKGYLGFSENRIVEKGKGESPEKPICRGIITPSLVNAHTHIGDSFIRNKEIELATDIKKLVEPPNGLKHKLLRETCENKIVEAIKKTVENMEKNGVSLFFDFRENGIKGINQIKKSIYDKKNIKPVILSRPEKLSYDKEEIDTLLESSHGIGVSSITDWQYEELKKIAMQTKNRKKIFAIHASERIREDVDLILDLKPDFLVHMVKATQSDLVKVKEEDIPIVICPRSNYFFNLKPDFKLMKETGVKLMLGTDNAMINSPSILDEIKYLRTKNNVFNLEELLRMSTYIPRKVLSHRPNILGLKSSNRFLVLDRKSMKPLFASKRLEGMEIL